MGLHRPDKQGVYSKYISVLRIRTVPIARAPGEQTLDARNRHSTLFAIVLCPQVNALVRFEITLKFR